MATYPRSKLFAVNVFPDYGSSREVTSCKNLTCFKTLPGFLRSLSLSVWLLYMGLEAVRLRTVTNSQKVQITLSFAPTRTLLIGPRKHSQSFRTAFQKSILREGHCSKALDSRDFLRKPLLRNISGPNLCRFEVKFDYGLFENILFRLKPRGKGFKELNLLNKSGPDFRI